MEFTLKEYDRLLKMLKSNNYKMISYREANFINENKLCILRHDIDMSVKQALEMSKVEKINGLSSTYFVLLRTNFYNVFSKETRDELLEIINNGCNIQLHFDETQYPDLEQMSDDEYVVKIKQYVEEECNFLSEILGRKVDVVSMHRPSKKILEENFDFGNILNAYSKKYFSEFKYLSDSRRHWREDVFQHIQNGLEKIHILTHPIWYRENGELSLKDTLKEFCNMAKVDRYESLKENIRDLESELSLEEL